MAVNYFRESIEVGRSLQALANKVNGFNSMANRQSPIQDVIREELSGLHFRFLLVKLITFFIPSAVGNRFRAWMFRLAGFQIGKGVLIMDNPIIIGDGDIYQKLTIGNNAFINAGCFLDLAGPITICDRVSFGPEVMLITGAHEIGYPSRRAGKMNPKPIVIGSGAWLGARCVVLPGITIGEGAIVGAGAVVTKDVLPNTIVGGIPAVSIRHIN